MHAYAAHTIECSVAVADAFSLRRAIVAFPMARICLENAVYCQYAVHHDDGMQALLHKLISSHQTVTQAIEDALGNRFEKDGTFYDSAFPEGKKHHERFTKTLSNFVDDPFLTMAYAVLSGYAHPSILTMQMYVDFAEGDNQVRELAFVSESRVDLSIAVHTAYSCSLALNAMQVATEGLLDLANFNALATKSNLPQKLELK